jgi:ABC-type lipoprotein export system ATPase subunit
VAGLTPSAALFFKFLVICFSASNALAGVFRLIAFCVPSMVAANAVGATALLILMLTNGFSIVRTSIPPYLIWVYYGVNPLAYAVRGLAINELTAPRWGPQGPAVLESFGFFTEQSWIWVGVAFCWGMLAAVTVLGAAALAYTNPPTPQPTMALEEQKQHLHRELLAQLQRTIGGGGGGGSRTLAGRLWSGTTIAPESLSAPPGSASSLEDGAAPTPPPGRAASAELHDGGGGGGAGAGDEGREDADVAVVFTPITLVCRDLSYYVVDPSGGAAPGVVDAAHPDRELAGTLQLLRGIDFFAEPGRLTALMGGSGAGKTTLMDVVAGRKTQGVTRGAVLVNGHAKAQASWARVVGYVEQMDIHSSRVTVLESLQFSARLRLDEVAVNDAQVAAIVAQTLRTVELGALGGAIVGDPGADGLSTEQRKRLSIAVELVANPSVLFMASPGPACMGLPFDKLHGPRFELHAARAALLSPRRAHNRPFPLRRHRRTNPPRGWTRAPRRS